MQQQIGVPPIIMQQAQPAFMQPMMQSQHAWIMSQHILSPLVQVRQQPSAVISHLHMPIVRLQQQIIMPFIVQQTLHIPPAIIAQRFCIIVQAAGSSHEQVIFIPPAHFSTFIAHRGTITMFGAIGMVEVPPIGMFPIPAIVERSIIIALVTIRLPKMRERWRQPGFPHTPTAQLPNFPKTKAQNDENGIPTLAFCDGAVTIAPDTLLISLD